MSSQGYFGLIVIFNGLRVARGTSEKLAEKLPAPELLDEICRGASGIQAVAALEKCYARSTGLQSSFKATNHLIELGHRRIAVIAGDFYF